MNIQDKKSRNKIILVSVFLALAILAYYLYSSSSIDLAKYEETSQVMQSKLSGKIKKINIAKGDIIEANILLLEMNSDVYKAEIELSKANIDLINAGKEPSSFPYSFTIKKVIEEKENEFSAVKTKLDALVKEYTYWANNLAKIQLQLRKPSTKEDEKAKLKSEKDNAEIMKKNADKQLESARSEYKRVEEEKYNLIKAQENVKNSYKNIFAWEEKIREAEFFIELCDYYSKEKIIILDVYVKENDEVEEGIDLFRYSLLAQ